ncbi:MAG TPA: HAD-IC family P-type ATPase, partial [Burkholderiaceae bacterium]
GRMASRQRSADPMEQAIVAVADRQLGRHGQARLERDFALQPDLLAMTLVWRDEPGALRVAAKGAVEAICDLCHLGDADAQALMRHASDLAGEGLRVLAVARGKLESGSIPARQHDIDFRPLGLLAFEDPLRASVPSTVNQARDAGIAVAMITGDHAATALAIARQAGIDTHAGALTGQQIEALDDAGLRAAVLDVRVFARVQPEQKLRLVRALAANGQTVAMTGDGVNDAPALKAAHIGIAMGARGTDVAREAAGLVLLDDDFGHIAAGVRMGRRIFDNLRRVMIYITAIHVPIAGLALLPVLLGLPPLLLPVHVVLTERVVGPACSLAFEGAPDDANVMQRPPRPSDSDLVGWPMLWRGTAPGRRAAGRDAAGVRVRDVTLRLGGHRPHLRAGWADAGQPPARRCRCNREPRPAGAADTGLSGVLDRRARRGVGHRRGDRVAAVARADALRRAARPRSRPLAGGLRGCGAVPRPPGAHEHDVASTGTSTACSRRQSMNLGECLDETQGPRRPGVLS